MPVVSGLPPQGFLNYFLIAIPEIKPSPSEIGTWKSKVGITGDQTPAPHTANW